MPCNNPYETHKHHYYSKPIKYQFVWERALGLMKRQTLLPNLLWICLVSRLVYPVLILNTILTCISFFHFGKMIGMVRSRTSFILSSQSCEIGSPPTGGAGRMKLPCVVSGHTHLSVNTVSVFWQFNTFCWKIVKIDLVKGCQFYNKF